MSEYADIFQPATGELDLEFADISWLYVGLKDASWPWYDDVERKDYIKNQVNRGAFPKFDGGPIDQSTFLMFFVC